VYINRTWDRPEEDDFKLNVQPKLDVFHEAVPVYWSNILPTSHDCIIGWRIQEQYE
jgi:hypothetical protein